MTVGPRVSRLALQRCDLESENPPSSPFGKGGKEGDLKPETRHPKPANLIRLHPANKSIREATFDVGVIAVGVPGKIVFLHPLCQLRRFFFQLLRRLAPVTP